MRSHQHEHEEEKQQQPTSRNSGRGLEIWVNEFTEKSAQEFREDVMMRADPEGNMVIPIYIDSYGGNVDALAKMIATMDEVPNRFITVCMGKAISCGAILLSHGDVRFCDKYSRVMIHNVSSVSWGDVYAMKASSDEGMRLNKIFMGLLAKNCNMSYEKLQENIKAATDSKEIWQSAQDALDFGIVDRIGLPDLVPIIQWACETVPDKERMASQTTKKTRAPKKPASTKKPRK